MTIMLGILIIRTKKDGKGVSVLVFITVWFKFSENQFRMFGYKSVN